MSPTDAVISCLLRRGRRPAFRPAIRREYSTCAAGRQAVFSVFSPAQPVHAGAVELRAEDERDLHRDADKEHGPDVILQVLKIKRRDRAPHEQGRKHALQRRLPLPVAGEEERHGERHRHRPHERHPVHLADAELRIQKHDDRDDPHHRHPHGGDEHLRHEVGVVLLFAAGLRRCGVCGRHAAVRQQIVHAQTVKVGDGLEHHDVGQGIASFP